MGDKDGQDVDPTTRTDRPGTLMWLTFDSGAGKSATAKALANPYSVAPSHGSKTGQKFIGPGGEIYRNEGEVRLPFLTEEGQRALGEFQVIDGLDQTLAAVSDSCDKGNLTIFDNDGSFVLNRESKEGQ